jgi:tRNA-2-methylthio-N6-dimethylallyladenosine synthase
MNERDAETCAGLLDEMGFVQAGAKEPADLILFVTCCIRENAEGKIFGHIGALSQECSDRGSYILAGGCMMQQPHVAEKIKKSYPQVKVIFGTHNIHRLPELILAFETGGKRVFEIWDKPGEPAGPLPAHRMDPHRAWVAIAAGCDNFCSYCVVPHVRGRERSRPMEEVMTEIRELAASGTLEITLLGQNVNSYGSDLGETDLFADLLHEIEKVDGILRVRFMTSHPKDLSMKLIHAMRDCPKVCAHLHLPVQSGSSRILARMNRKYTSAHYLGLVDRIRTEMPDIALSTDLIVGFPGETDEDFEETCILVDQVGFDFAFLFLYSPRKGTPAASFPDQVPSSVASARFQRLLKMQTERATEIAKHLEGAVLEVLAEGRSKEDESMFSGRTSGNRLVNFTSPFDPSGKLVPVRIVRAGAFWLLGEVVG